MTKRNLGSSDTEHTEQAKVLVNEAWGELERMPSTCEGGIKMAARALATAQRAQAHLWSVAERAGNEELHALANGAEQAARDTVNFFARTCQAPGGEARERPLTSRAAFQRMLVKEAKKRARKRRG